MCESEYIERQKKYFDLINVIHFFLYIIKKYLNILFGYIYTYILKYPFFLYIKAKKMI